MDFNVIDNFLPENHFLKIESNFMGHLFPWFYSDTVTYHDNAYQFTHTLFDEHQLNSDYFPLMYPILNKLNVMSLVRIKANCIPKTNVIEKHGYHTDAKNCKTALLYINDNNGSTEFEAGETVLSKRNRLVEFDSNLKHRGTTCTDQNIRVNINFNYFKHS